MSQVDHKDELEIKRRENEKMEIKRELSDLAKKHPEISSLVENKEVIELCAQYKQAPQLLNAHEIMRMFGKTPEDEQYANDLYHELLKAVSERDEAVIKNCMERLGIKTIIHAEGPTVWDHVHEATDILNKQETDPEYKRMLFLTTLLHDIGKLEVNDLQTTAENIKRKADVAKAGTLVTPMIGHASEKIVSGSFAALRELLDKMVESDAINETEARALIKACAEHMNNLPKIPETLPTVQEIKNPDTTILSYIDSLGGTDEEKTAALALIIATKQIDGIGTYTYTYDSANRTISYGNGEDEKFPSPKTIMAYYLVNKEAKRLKDEAAEKSRRLMEVSKKVFKGKELPQIVSELGIDRKQTGRVKQIIEQYITDNNLLLAEESTLADHEKTLLDIIKQSVS